MPSSLSKVFVSHANPADNEFAAWLSSRLTGLGYDVWVDLNQFVGGSRTWEEIENVLKDQARKVIFVVSPRAVKAEGVRNEISFANKVGLSRQDKRFIIPIILEHVPPTEMNIEISDSFYIKFEPDWGLGLAELNRTLEEEKVPIRRNRQFDSSFWTTARLRPTQQVISRPETYFSNWYEIECGLTRYCVIWLEREIFRNWQPADLRPDCKLIDRKEVIFYPVHVNEATERNVPAIIPKKSYRFISVDDLQDFQDRQLAAIIGNDFAERVNSAWITTNIGRGLKQASLSRGACPVWVKSTTPGVQMVHVGTGDRRLIRKMTGSAKEKFWHFGLEGRAISASGLFLSVQPHVLFSSDGENLPDLKPAAGRLGTSFAARRRWFNDEWRSLIELHMRWLANDDEQLTLQLEGGASVLIRTAPVSGEVPVTYIDPYVSGGVEPLSLDDFSDEAENDSEAGYDE